MVSKANDAGVDLSLWNVGGDAPGMEQAWGAICLGLHAAWQWRLMLEVVHWFSHHADCTNEEQCRNHEALADCVG